MSSGWVRDAINTAKMLGAISGYLECSASLNRVGNSKKGRWLFIVQLFSGSKIIVYSTTIVPGLCSKSLSDLRFSWHLAQSYNRSCWIWPSPVKICFYLTENNTRVVKFPSQSIAGSYCHPSTCGVLKRQALRRFPGFRRWHECMRRRQNVTKSPLYGR